MAVVAIKGGAQGAATRLDVDDILSGHDKFVAMMSNQQLQVETLEQQALTSICVDWEKSQNVDEVANKYKDVQVAKDKLIAITNVVKWLECKLPIVAKEAAQDDPRRTQDQLQAKFTALQAKQAEDQGWIDQLCATLKEVERMVKPAPDGQKSSGKSH